MKPIYGPNGRVATRIHDHPDDPDGFVIERGQDVEPILELNKVLATEGDGYNADRTMKRVASIPNVVIEQWINESGVNIMALPKHEFAKFIRRKLTDPDWRHLLTSPGGM